MGLDKGIIPLIMDLPLSTILGPMSVGPVKSSDLSLRIPRLLYSVKGDFQMAIWQFILVMFAIFACGYVIEDKLMKILEEVKGIRQAVEPAD